MVYPDNVRMFYFVVLKSACVFVFVLSFVAVVDVVLLLFVFVFVFYVFGSHSANTHYVGPTQR